MSKGNSISKFYKSFSGTDTIAFLMFPGINPITIGSLTTVSYSMYRNKVPVINIGRTNINGITRGSRIYAGTMVFTLINKHWVRELQDQATYLENFPTLKTDELPLFDIMIVSANEYGNSCVMFIYGVDFTDEAQTISVEDLFTENVFKFVAREVAVFDKVVVNKSETEKKFYTVTTGVIKNFYTDEQARQTDANLVEYDIKPLNRTLYYIAEKPMMGSDVAAVQQLLNMALENLNMEITYKFDRMMDAAVRDFQTTVGLIVNGVVDNNVYTKLLQYTRTGVDNEYVQVINKSGAYVYLRPDNESTITQVLPYLSSVEVFGQITNKLERYYKTENGYVSTYDVYHYLDNRTDSFTYEQLQFGDEGPQVTILQNLLGELYNNFRDYTVGTFDEKTEQYIRMFQRNNNLEETGICDYYTWNIILNMSSENDRKYIYNHADVITSKDPGIYYINDLEELSSYTNTINNNSTQQVKYSVISVYENNITKTDSKTLVFNGSQTHSVDEFKNMFKDDVENQTPVDVYYIIYPYGSLSLKWHFKFK